MLADALKQVRERIALYRGRSSSIGEQNTKAALIEPVLQALGWEVVNPDEVWREYRRRTIDNPVDYALMILRTPRLFVEAKSLGENLDDPKWASQIMGYAVVAGVEWVVLTNGDEYRIYNSHAAVPVEEKLFRTIRLTADSSDDSEALSVLSRDRTKDDWIGALWRSHFIDRQLRGAIESMFPSDPDPSVVRLLTKRLPGLSVGDIKAGLGRVRVKLDFPGTQNVDDSRVPITRTSARLSSRPRQSRPPDQRSRPRSNTSQRFDVSVRDLIDAGFVRPPLDLEKTYKGRVLTGRLESGGRVSCLGRSFDTLSTSAAAARASVLGNRPGEKHPPTNGWAFWKFRDSDGQYRPIDVLRQRFVDLGHRSAT